MEDSAQGGKTLRREIAISTRILQAQGILGYSGHVSARLPDGSGFLIQPRKTSRAEVTPEDILTVDNEGIQTGGPTDDTPPGEVAIHAAILKARPEMGAVIHFHPKAATLFSMVEDVVLAPMKNHAYRWRSGIPVHPDSSHIKTATQGQELAKTLGPHFNKKAYIVDVNTGKQNKELDGFQIHDPETFSSSRVDSVVVTSRSQLIQADITKSANKLFPGLKNIRLYPLNG